MENEGKSKTAVFGPGEIKENAKENEMEEEIVEEGEKLRSEEEKYLKLTEEQVAALSEAEQDEYWTHGLSEEDKKKGEIQSESKTHQEGGPLISGGTVVMEVEKGMVAAASVSPCSSIGEGGGARGDKIVKGKEEKGEGIPVKVKGKLVGGGQPIQVVVAAATPLSKKTVKKKGSVEEKGEEVIDAVKAKLMAHQKAFAELCSPICPGCNQRVFDINMVMHRGVHDKCDKCEAFVCAGCLMGEDISPTYGLRRVVKQHVTTCKYLLAQPWTELRLQYLSKQGVKGAEKMTMSEQDMHPELCQIAIEPP